MAEEAEKIYRSVSQVTSYERCPYSYYLDRIEKAWKRPSAWLPQGTAVHTAAEVYESTKLAGHPISLEQARKIFQGTYKMEVNFRLRDTPNMNFWSKSGPYSGEVDIKRRHGLGLEMVDRYVEYSEAATDVIWVDEDGNPGLEKSWELELGGVPIRGFTDQVRHREDNPGVARPIDLKTGKSPGDAFQLAVYAEELRQNHGLVVHQGSYWMGRTGQETTPYDLSEWTTDRLTEVFVATDAEIKKGNFPPKPGKQCATCDVSLSCKYRA